MRVIDAHVHLYPPEAGREPTGWAAARGEAHWAVLCTRRRQDGRPVQGFPGVDGLLRAMDAAGVGRAVLLGWYWENHATCVEQNRFYAGCVRAHPDRLGACATVHPAAGAAALAEMRRVRDEGFVGLGELSPHSQHFDLGDPFWREVLALAGELKLPVNLHVTDPAGREYPGRVATPLEDFRGMALAFPGTVFVLAHWGGGLAAAREFAGLANVYYDTAASPLLYRAGDVPGLLAALPVDKVLFGSDYPLTLYPAVESAPELGRILGELRAAGATDGLLGGNAARLFGL